jgi:DNA polymerase-1
MTPTELPPPGTPDVLYVVDILSFVFRAYYAIGHLSNSKGAPTGAVLGVVRMLLKLLIERKPAYLAVASDSKGPTWRKQEYPEYKANRQKPPQDLLDQIPVALHVAGACGIPVLEREGFEADDVIATVTRRARDAGLRTVIVTGDKDLMQLVGDGVVVYDTMRDAVYGPGEVEAKFGVGPSRLGDLLALMGDSSDNVPGVPGVGPKSAAKLLHEHQTLDAVLAAAPTIKGALGERLVSHAGDARISRRLVELREDVDVDCDVSRLRFSSPDLVGLRPVLEELELKQVLKELYSAPAPDELGPPRREYRTISTRDGLEDAVARIRAAGEVSVDLETTSLDSMQTEIVGIALSWRPLEGWYVPVRHQYLGAPEQLALDDVLATLRPVLEDPSIKVYGQNFKYDDVILKQHGVEVANVAFDTMMASYLLDPGKRSHGMDQLAADVLGYTTITYDEVTQKTRGSQLRFDEVDVESATRYAAEDAEVVMTLVKTLEPRVREAGFDGLLRDVELPLGRVLADMERVGVSVDVGLLGELSRSVGVQLAELEQRAHEAAGRRFNVSSPKQLAEVLFDEIGLDPVKKTKGKTARSTDVEVLTDLSGLHPLPGIVLEHRQLAKLKGTYLDGLPRLVNPTTRRIHTSYNQAVAATGRLSSSEPNLQNIPIRTDLGRQIRRAFVAPEGTRLLAADYSQVELRVLAHLSGDPLLLDSFSKREDVHARTAREIFGIPQGEPVPPDLRRRAKAINFGVIYGQTEYGLAKELGIGRAEAGEFIAGYFARYAGVKAYMDHVVEEARGGEGVRTLAGRRRFIPDISSNNHTARLAAERMARNTPIQGTAADIMKKAMVTLHKRLKDEHLGSRMVLTVHDELVLEVPEAESERAAAIVEQEMMGAEALDVPLVVDLGWGSNWADAH